MGYYVPNRVMPVCYNCPYRTNKYCGLLTEHDYLGDYTLNYELYPYCPLVEVKEPHGRLIDIREMREFVDRYHFDYKHIEYYATTVIEAEGE